MSLFGVANFQSAVSVRAAEDAGRWPWLLPGRLYLCHREISLFTDLAHDQCSVEHCSDIAWPGLLHDVFQIINLYPPHG